MKNNRTNNYTKWAITAFILFLAADGMAQIPPAGKYNTTNYPEDRKAIALLSMAKDSAQHLNDDYIAVGPEGKISYGVESWKKGFADKGATFKSVKVVPGTLILRIYNGDAAVKNMVLDVVFSTPKGDLSITVIRTEVYIKQNGKWYFVGGQGTKSLNEEELKELEKKSLNKN